MLNVSLTKWHRQRFKPIFACIERACKDVGVEFYLVGPVARDISMAIHGMESSRVTRDLDVAVLVTDGAEYQRLKNSLLTQGDFTEVRGISFTLKYADQTDVDLMPFGGVELDGNVRLNRDEGLANLSVTGFNEVYAHGTQSVTLDDEYTFQVCGLPGMVVLKLIAYDDRPEHRLTDLADISFILKNYLDITSESIYDTHYDLLEASDSMEHTAARILGRDIRPLLDPSPALRQRIIDILDRALADGPEGLVVRHLHAAQLLTPYKEVLEIYDNGLKVPEDVTLVWPDDNYGYIQRLNNKQEQTRKGGAGVYYHASYWGRPHDYLWLPSANPALMTEEMLKAYNTGADRLWVLNVGDIKPLEYNIQHFLDMAFNSAPFRESSYTKQHLSQWATALFGREKGPNIGTVLWGLLPIGF